MDELTEEVRVAAPLDAVWNDWTDAAAIEEWFWPARFEPAAHIVPEPSGTWLVRSIPAGMAVLGTIVSRNEVSWLEVLREASGNTDPVITTRARSAIRGIFGK